MNIKRGSQKHLISLIEERPWLWKPNHRDYKNKIMESHAWKTISTNMKLPGRSYLLWTKSY